MDNTRTPAITYKAPLPSGAMSTGLPAVAPVPTEKTGDPSVFHIFTPTPEVNAYLPSREMAAPETSEP